MSDDEMSDEELERQMRRKLLLNGKSARSAPDDVAQQAQRVAEKWMGRDNAERLQRRRPDAKPFRPKPVVVVAEYYEVPPQQTSWSSFGGGWRIDVRENGVVRNSQGGMSRDGCLDMIARLERRGVKSKAIITEWMKQNEKQQAVSPPESRRKTFAERYGDFDGDA